MSSERFRQVVLNKEIAFPTITLGEITDKSKGSLLLNLIAFVHTLWFVMQCGARVHRQLAFTELEFVTLSLIPLHAYIYRIWWHKPSLVHEPIKIITIENVVQQTFGPGLQGDASEFFEVLAKAPMFLSSKIHDFFCRSDTFRKNVWDEAARHLKESRTDLFKFFKGLWTTGPREFLPIFGSFIVVISLLFITLSIPFLLTFLCALSFILSIVRLDSEPSLVNHGLIGRIVFAFSIIRHGLTGFLDRPVSTSRSGFLFTIFIVFPMVFILVLVGTPFLFILIFFATFSEINDGLSGVFNYILEISKKTIQAMLAILQNPCENGPLKFISIPMFLISFLLFLSLAPFVLATALILSFTNTEDDDFDSETYPAKAIFVARSLLIHYANDGQGLLDGILKDSKESDFAILYHISFPLIFLVSFCLFVLISLFDFLCIISPIGNIVTLLIYFVIILPIYIVITLVTASIFYIEPTEADHYSQIIVFAFGIIFGGLQCLGWDFRFPIHSILHMSWRITCLAIAVILVIASLVYPLLINHHNRFSQVAIAVLASVYMLARLSLIPQASVLLRTQPPSAFITVGWTKYIPHIGL